VGGGTLFVRRAFRGSQGARVLQAAGFVERDDWHELVYTSRQTGE
jgi:hypothetical protein